MSSKDPEVLEINSPYPKFITRFPGECDHNDSRPDLDIVNKKLEEPLKLHIVVLAPVSD